MNSNGVKVERWRIIILSGSFGIYAPEAIETLNRIGEVKRLTFSSPPKDSEVAEAIRGYDAVILGAIGRISAETLRNVENLKVIARHGVGYDNVDVQEATRRRIAVTYTPHANAESVAEHTFTLILALMRRIYEAYSTVKNGRWSERSKLIGFEIYGKTLGVIGFGAIGRRVAEIAIKGFNMKVLAYDPYVNREEMLKLNVKPVDLKELLKESDIVSIHAILTSETHHLIGEEMLKQMKSSALIVNTARGPIIDEEALIKALREKWIAGAALDVLETEPPNMKNPLLKMDNVLVTPHIAAFTVEALKRMDLMIVEDIDRIYNGLKPRRLVNPEVATRLGLRDS
ncbi:MAG: phosphoglycerate dehydrogenase [Candidatus Methanomethylicia archaeon]